MIDPVSKLTVLHDDNSVFSDHTENAADYIRDDFSMELIAAEDYLYLGYYKPFNAAYVALTTANINANDMAMEYYDGTSWQSRDVTDESKGFTRSGFMLWDSTGMESVEINGETKYYVRFKPSADHSVSSIRGINLVFSDDNALKGEFYEIDNSSLLPPGQDSHLVHHVASRNTIIQKLRNMQYIKSDANGQDVNMTQWDLFDLFEIKQAAVMLTLSKIFFNLSDNQDDNWWSKYREYQDKFEDAFNLARISLDEDDDGVEDARESLKKAKVNRWQR